MGDITLRQALEEYKTIYLASRNFAERSRVEYLNDIQDLINFLEHSGLKQVRNIGLPQLERYLAELDCRKSSNSTRKRKVITIRSFLNYLYQERYINLDLSKRLIPPISEANTPRYLTKLEYEKLLATSQQNQRDFTIIQLLLETGIKLSELIRLTIYDVEIPTVMSLGGEKQGLLHIKGKARKKGRILQLTNNTCTALRSYLETSNNRKSSSLFINRFGKNITSRGVEKIIQKYLSQIDIGAANVQSLRNTFGIYQLLKGVSKKEVQKLMGYEDLRSLRGLLTIFSS